MRQWAGLLANSGQTQEGPCVTLSVTVAVTVTVTVTAIITVTVTAIITATVTVAVAESQSHSHGKQSEPRNPHQLWLFIWDDHKRRATADSLFSEQ